MTDTFDVMRTGRGGEKEREYLLQAKKSQNGSP